MKRLLGALLGAAILSSGVIGGAGPAAAQGKCTIALIPGLTTDAFYITMRKGAEMAAKAVGCELLFQGAPDFNPTTQVPVLQAVIARKPDAILIAPTDKQQLIAPLQQAIDAGIPVITVDTFIDDGKYQDGSGPGDFPRSYIATDNVLGGFLAGSGAGQAGRRQGQGLRLQRQARDQHHRPARRGLQGGDAGLPRHHGAGDPVQRRRRQQGGLPGPGGVRPQSRPRRACSAPTCSRPSVPPTASRRWARPGEIRVVAFDAPSRIVDDLKSGLIDLAVAQHPAEIGYYGVMTAYAVINGQSVPPQIGTGATIMTKDNIDDPAVMKFVYSD